MTDTEYWARRARQEARLAMEATSPAAMSAHYKLSNACLKRAQLFSEEPAADESADGGVSAGSLSGRVRAGMHVGSDP